MVTHKQSEIWGNLWQIIDLSEKLLFDFEKVMNNVDLSNKLPYIEMAYIDSIIIHIAKIFSSSKNESFRLAEFKMICRLEIKEEFQNVEDEYADIIGKIITNRNKIVAHLDKNFYELHFSENEIIKMEEDMARGLDMSLEDTKAIYAAMPRTIDKTQERYSIHDFHNDFPSIKQIIEKLSNIWSRSIPFADKETVDDFK